MLSVGGSVDLEMDGGRREKECNSSFGEWEGSPPDN